MASETGLIPDLYFPEDDLELQTSSVEGKEGGGQGGEVKKKKPVDLTLEGFIPIHKLTLEDLPEPIRTEEHLQYILDVSKDVVKINNNSLSDKRPDDDEFKQKQQKSLCGSGFISNWSRCNVSVITNRHVLFNEEELSKSTFDIFYDYHFGDPNDEKKLFRRCVRQDGTHFTSKLSKDDIVCAAYDVKDEMIAHITENCCLEDNKTSCRVPVKHQNVADDPYTPPVVCLISHPLGQPKHVSFGELLDYNMHSRTVHHSAPSKQGSSGGRILVFASPFISQSIFHVGKEKGKGYASVDPWISYLSDLYSHVDGTKHRAFRRQMTTEEMTQKESTSLEMGCFIALVPVFGAFLLHTQEPCLAARDTSTLKPCKTSLEVPHDLKQSVRELIQSLTQVAPSFALCPSSNSSDASDLISLLETQGPCYCQSIVKMMERGVKLEDGTVTECYLSPNTAAAKMSSDGDVTWPWLNRSKSDVRDDNAAEECILENCLKSCEGDIIAVILLLMITKANACVKELYLQPCDASLTATDCNSDSQWETIYVRTMHIHSSEQKAKKWPGERQDSSLQEKMKNLSSSRAETEGDGDVTWPWLNRNNSDVRDDNAAEECILENCLKSCEGVIIAVILLLMITKANACVKELYLQPCDASSTVTDCNSDSQWETVYVRTTHVHCCEERAKNWSGERQDSPPQERMKNLTSSRAEYEGDGRRLRFSEDILTLLRPVLYSFAAMLMDLPEDNHNVLYSRCVALSEHARQHEVQIHPDTERARGDNGGNWCHCGRPGMIELCFGSFHPITETLQDMVGGTDAFKTKMASIRQMESNGTGEFTAHFNRFVRGHSSKLFHPNPSKKSSAEKSEEISTDQEPHRSPGDLLCSLLDEYFHRRQSLMLYLASREASMYNLRLLVRHICKYLQHRYYAFPVSVFGRPGNWPGNVTPPEVQRTAWRLIQDAIMASGFRPADLAALEKDAYRREKLIDLYVDMKQLKWERQIHPHLFKTYQVFSAGKMANHLQSALPFEDATHYYVWYAAYLVCPRTLEYRGSTSQRQLLR